MPNVDELVIRAIFRDELSAGIAKTEGQLAALNRQVQQIGGPTHQRQVKALGGGLDQLQRSASTANASLNKMSASLASITGRGIRDASIGLGALSAAATGFGLKASASFEQSRIAFGTLLGNVDQGNQLFARLQSFNLATPFNLSQIAGATQTLLQFGFTGDNVMQTLKGISDVAATSGPQAGENLGRIALALGQINSAGVIRAQDLNQLVQAGFPAYQVLQDITGQTSSAIRKQMESGLELPASKFIDAVNGQMGVLARYANGAQQQANTLSGVWSNFTDRLQTRLSTAFDPLAVGLKRDLPGLTDQLGAFIDATAPALSRFVSGLIGVITQTLPIIQPVLSALLDGLSTLLTAAAPAFAALRPVMADLGVAIGQMVTELVPVMPDLVAAFVALVGVLPDMVRLLTAFVPLLGPLADLVGTLARMDGVASGLLVTLLAYRALSGIVGIVVGFAQAITALATAQSALNAANGGGAASAAVGLGRYGRAGGLALGGVGVAGAGLASGPSVLGDLATVGGLAATGAGIGSIFPGPGTAIGAGVGAIIGGGLVAARRLSDHPAAPAAPAPVMVGGGTAVTSSTVVQPGGITVYHPTANVDITQAIDDYNRQQARRAGSP